MHNKILPSGLCAEICCNRGEKKDFQVELGLFRDLFRGTSGLQSFFLKYAGKSVIDKKIFYNNSRTVSFFQIYRHGTLLRYSRVTKFGQSSTVIHELTFFGKRISMFAYILGDIAMKTGNRYFQKFWEPKEKTGLLGIINYEPERKKHSKAGGRSSLLTPC